MAVGEPCAYPPIGRVNVYNANMQVNNGLKQWRELITKHGDDDDDDEPSMPLDPNIHGPTICASLVAYCV